MVRLLTARAAAAVVLIAMLASACGDSSPTRPTPPPAADPLALTCPAAVTQQSPSSQPVPVRYGIATAAGGVPPVQITCTPGNDTLFPVGSTTVTCTGVDTRGTTASCSFGVTVTAAPRISLTTFVAFGDSITAGEITVAGEGNIRTLQLMPALSYPTDLRTSLAGRYTSQTISMTNQGLKGENTFDGLTRLGLVLSGTQVLLLVEGANDISNASAAQVQAALNNIRSMVRLAKSRNVRVFVGSLPPENPFTCVTPCRAGGYGQLSTYNAGLQAIASSEIVPFVDVFAAFHNDVTTLIGPDGLHPTALGYAAMANAFFDAIRATLEVTSVSTVTPAASAAPAFPPRLPLAAPPRRR